MLERKFAVIVFLVSTVVGSVLASNKHPGQLHITLPMPPNARPVRTEMVPTPLAENAPTQVSTETSAAMPAATALPDASRSAAPAEIGKASSAACQAPDDQDTKSIARRFMVPQADILSWFCQGYGIGEIELAYSISAYANVPVNEVLDRRASGLGWGQIEQDYGLKSSNNKQALNNHKNNNKVGGKTHGKSGKHGKKP